MIAFGDFMTLNLVTTSHIWSQVVTLVTVEVKNPNKNYFDGSYGSMALKKELFGRRRVRRRRRRRRRRRNASLIDLMAFTQVKKRGMRKMHWNGRCLLGSHT